MATREKKILKWGSMAVFFLIIVVFGFFRSYDLLFGVKIRNVNIVDGSKASDSILKVTGNAKNAVDLTLDGREISVDKDGNFNETVALLSGYNVLTIVAKDKFGSVDEKNYKLMY